MIRDPLLGAVVDDRYRLDKVVGRGGFGTVYRGTHLKLGRPVAIKILSGTGGDESVQRERFHLEARLLDQLRHPSIVRLKDFGEAEGLVFMVQEFIEGSTLEDHIREYGPIDLPRAVTILSDVLEGLAEAHEAGVVHRDIKPANIMLPPSAGGRLLDFGIATLLGEARKTRTGMLVGTPQYMAPEYIQGASPGPSGDLYAMGGVLFFCLTGNAPFEASSGASPHSQLLSHIEAPIPRLPAGFIPGVQALIDCALAKEPSDRFATASDMCVALRTVIEGGSIDGRATPPIGSLPPVPPSGETPTPLRETRILTPASNGNTAPPAARATALLPSKGRPLAQGPDIVPQHDRLAQMPDAASMVDQATAIEDDATVEVWSGDSLEEGWSLDDGTGTQPVAPPMSPARHEPSVVVGHLEGDDTLEVWSAGAIDDWPAQSIRPNGSTALARKTEDTTTSVNFATAIVRQPPSVARRTPSRAAGHRGSRYEVLFKWLYLHIQWVAAALLALLLITYVLVSCEPEPVVRRVSVAPAAPADPVVITTVRPLIVEPTPLPSIVGALPAAPRGVSRPPEQDPPLLMRPGVVTTPWAAPPEPQAKKRRRASRRWRRHRRPARRPLPNEPPQPTPDEALTMTLDYLAKKQCAKAQALWPVARRSILNPPGLLDQKFRQYCPELAQQ